MKKIKVLTNINIVIVVVLIITLLILSATISDKQASTNAIGSLGVALILSIISLVQLNKKKKTYVFNGILKDNNFIISKTYYLNKSTAYLDEANKKLAINTNVNIKFIDFKDIINYEVYQDGSKTMSGGVGGAMIGAVLGSATGAIIGSSVGRKIKDFTERLELRIRINNIQNPDVSVTIINNQIKNDTPAYEFTMKKLREFLSLLEYILNQNKENKETKVETNANT